MVSIVQKCVSAGVAKPPPFVAGSVQYETIMGSNAYGVSGDLSDCDVYGFCMPPKDLVFPHLRGEIQGFGRQVQRFDVWQQHHMQVNETSYDVSIFSIVRFFHLCMENNPNMIDSLFTPQRCVVFCTPLGDMVRERRRLFLHKGAWHKFKGYAYAQLENYFAQREKDLESVYSTSKLRHSPDEAAIRSLLMHCLEHFYGDLSRAVVGTDKAENVLRDICAVLSKAGYTL